MKKLLLGCLFLASIGVFAQTPKKIAQKISEFEINNTKFQKFNVLNVSSERKTEIDQVVNDATYAKIDMEGIQNIYESKLNTIEISIPYQGQNIDVKLYRVNPLTEDFTLNTNLKSNVAYTPGVYYRGIIAGNSNSLAAFNFFEDKFSGFVSSDELSNLNIVKLRTDNNVNDYAVYADKNLFELPNWSCETDDFSKSTAEDNPESMEFLGANKTERCVTMYYEMDYHLFYLNGSDIENTMDWMTEAFNGMQTLYDNDDITVALNDVFIWETTDPYQGAGGSSDYLEAFHTYRPVFAGDVGQLIGVYDNSGGGVAATIDGLCNDLNYSYAGVNLSYPDLPTYSWTMMVMTHENGHVLGSRHTHACVWNGNNTAIDGCAGYVEGNCSLPGNPSEGGTMMSYCHLQSVGINFNLGFGEQPKTVIVNNINENTCLSTDCVSVCFNTVVDIEVSEITDNQATVTWVDSDEEASAWEFAARPLDSTDELVWNSSNQNSGILTDLDPNTYYNIYVRKICGDLFTEEVSDIFATNGDFCNGALFTDSGGENNGYSNNEDITRTIIPTNANEKVKITFTSFNLQDGFDFLYIYNGLDTNSPELIDGGLTGNEGLNNSFESTDDSGALTFRFISDGVYLRPGWVGEIECLTLGVNDTDAFIDFSYYPNPVTNELNINSKNQILSVSLHSIDGKRILTNSVNSLSTVVNMANLPVGTYVVKLNFKDKPVEFKILKK